MTVRTSLFSGRYLPISVSSFAGEVISQDYFYDLPAAQSILNDIIDIGVLPAGHTISDAILMSDDLDTNGAPTIALDVGIMSGNPGETGARTCGNELFAADVAARTGVTSRMSKLAGFNILPTDLDRSIGVKIQAAAATAATTGRVRLRVFMHAADRGIQF